MLHFWCRVSCGEQNKIPVKRSNLKNNERELIKQREM
jgi:hypothetical protein